MAASSPVGEISQQFSVGTRGVAGPPSSHGVPVVAEVRSLSSPSGAGPASSCAPRHSSSPPGHGASLIPAPAGARQLAKLKRFLASILQYAHDISPEVGDKVQDLVVRVVNSTIAPEDFQRQFQEATNFPLRPFVLPFLKVSTNTLNCID
jgi:runt-related transcription factor 1